MARPTPSATTRSNAVGYLRRSTDRQEQSIPDQEKAVIEYAKEHELRIVDFYVDDAISGTSTLGRRAFQGMIADAQRDDRGWSSIIVYDVKRFGRIDNDEAGHYRYILRRNGVQVHYVDEVFTGDGTDDLLRPVKQWQARQESKDLSKVTIRGLLSRSEGGWWMGGVPPLGYDLRYENDRGEFLFILRHMPDATKKVLDEGGALIRILHRGESLNISKRDRARLAPSDACRVQIVRDIFHMYIEEGKGFKAIADTLNRKGAPPVRGPSWSHIYTGKWADSTVRAILTNRLYTGDMIWNRRTDGRFHRISNGRAVERADVHGARLVPNEESEWIVIRDSQPALISRALFEGAHQRQEERKGSRKYRGRRPVGGWKGARSRFILTGLILCEGCGNRYQGRSVTKGMPEADGSRIRTHYYACGGKVRNGKGVCSAREVQQDILEATVGETLVRHYGDFDGTEGRARLSAIVREQRGENSVSLAEARRRLLEKQSRLDEVVNNLLENITNENRDFIDERLKGLRGDRDEIRVGLEQIDALVEAQAAIGDAVREAREFLRELPLVLAHGVPEEKRVALRRCIEKIRLPTQGTRLSLDVYRVPTNDADAVEVKARLPARSRSRGTRRKK